MKYRLKLLLVLLGIGAFGGSIATAATSPNQQGITITPFLQKISIAGFEATKSFTVTVTNHTSTSRSFTSTVADFGSLNESGGIAFLGQNQNQYAVQHGLKSWLTLDQSNLTLGPGKSTTLTGTIRNDTTLAPGGHYGAVLIDEVRTGSSQSNAVGANPTVTALIFADKLGGEHYDLHLDSFQTGRRWFFPPSGATLRFYNPGNIEVTPRGTVELSSGSKVISKGIINDDSGLVLPATYRTMYVPFTRLASSGWLPKRLTVAVHYRYDGIEQVSTKTASVFYWNLPHALGLLLFLGLVTGALWRYRQSLWKRLRAIQHHP